MLCELRHLVGPQKVFVRRGTKQRGDRRAGQGKNRKIRGLTVNSMHASLPRFSAGEISLWYTGTHMLRKPTPKPEMMRPKTMTLKPVAKD